VTGAGEVNAGAVCVLTGEVSEGMPEGEWDGKTTAPGHAYQAIFNRRLQRGQSYASLCLGWKEFTPSYFGLFREATKVCTEMPDIRIPSMLRNIFPKGYKSEYQAVYDTDLIIHKGTLVYPERRDVS
jgi:CRISPR-associated protein Cas5d